MEAGSSSLTVDNTRLYSNHYDLKLNEFNLLCNPCNYNSTKMNLRNLNLIASAILLCLSLAGSLRADIVIDFTDLSLPVNSFFNGGPTTNANGWSSGLMRFGNAFDDTFGSWNGFAYSNVNAPNTSGFGNQYAAVTGTGVGGNGIYALAYNGFDGDQSFFNLPTGFSISSVQVTNTAYAYFSMLNGDQFAKKFGSGDFFRLNFTGYDQLNGTGATTGSVQFALADFTGSNSFILNTWSNVSLTALGQAKSVRLSFTSSDTSIFSGVEYINTPTYAAFDNFVITAIPEPSSLMLVFVSIVGLSGRRRKEDC